MNKLGRLFFCFEIAVVIILSGQFLRIGLGAVGDGPLLRGGDAKKAIVKEVETGSWRQAAWTWAGNMAGCTAVPSSRCEAGQPGCRCSEGSVTCKVAGLQSPFIPTRISLLP